MQKLLIYLLIVAYGSCIIQPIVPYVDYKVNMEYYAQVACKNKDKPQLHCEGKCVLAKKLEEAAKQTHPQSSEVPPTLDIPDILTAHLSLVYHFRLIETASWTQHTKNNLYAQHSLSPPSPPPRPVDFTG